LIGMTRPVCIVGTGYAGMACQLGLADLGWKVHGYDIAPERIERLRRGITPYREPLLEESLRNHLASGKVEFFDSLDAAAREAQVIIIAVNTPSHEDGSTDLSAVYTALENLSKIEFATWPCLVVRSAVPPGTSDGLNTSVRKWADLVISPEFLREGSALRDFLNPDRIVVGCDSPAQAVPYVRLLEPLQKPVVFTTRSNAELIRNCSNAFLALKISFANEVANLCDAFGATADDVLRGIGYDGRIGSRFLQPGIGFGGPCFEKDLKSLEFVSRQFGIGPGLFTTALQINEQQPHRIVRLLEEELGSLDGATIGIWGLAFKAGTDDIRGSLALRIVDELAFRGAKMIAYDPAVHLAPLPSGSRMVPSALEAADADALVVLTEWPEFARIDPHSYATAVTRRVVIDGRNVLEPHRVAAAGLIYRGIGRSFPAAAEQRPLASAQLV
jgi:UDPglucose 6-dehydrogenase